VGKVSQGGDSEGSRPVVLRIGALWYNLSTAVSRAEARKEEEMSGTKDERRVAVTIGGGPGIEGPTIVEVG